jgi:hypothetical protein
MDLFTAINNPGTGASMRRALKVLAREWRRRGGYSFNVSYAERTGSDMDDGANRRRYAVHRDLVARMPPSLLQRQLTKLGACKEAIAWAGQFSTARQAWEACTDEEWMWNLVGDLYRERRVYDEMCDVAQDAGEENSPEALAAIRRVVPFERLRELSREK